MQAYNKLKHSVYISKDYRNVWNCELLMMKDKNDKKCRQILIICVDPKRVTDVISDWTKGFKELME